MASSNNPRKFSEKIALHNQKQAEETAAFEEVMKDLNITRAARVRPSNPRLFTFCCSAVFAANERCGDKSKRFDAKVAKVDLMLAAPVLNHKIMFSLCLQKAPWPFSGYNVCSVNQLI